MGKSDKGGKGRHNVTVTGVIPASSLMSMIPIPDLVTLHEAAGDPLKAEPAALVTYLRRRGRAPGYSRTIDLIRGQNGVNSIFKGVDDLWARNAVQLSANFEAGFDFDAYEAANPDVKAKVDAAVAAIVASKA